MTRRTWRHCTKSLDKLGKSSKFVWRFSVPVLSRMEGNFISYTNIEYILLVLLVPIPRLILAPFISRSVLNLIFRFSYRHCRLDSARYLVLLFLRPELQKVFLSKETFFGLEGAQKIFWWKLFWNRVVFENVSDIFKFPLLNRKCMRGTKSEKT